MTKPTEHPASYSLERLLSEGCQPFPDMTPEAFEELKASIKARGLQEPVKLTGDGTNSMFDGHQRCQALIALGKKRISAGDVRIVPGVTRESMWEAAITANSVRRHLTSNDKAQAMHRCAAHGWSQRKIARAFGMAQPSVQYLMSTYQREGDVPAPSTITGDDGKTYQPAEPKDPKTKAHPWAWNGVNFKIVQRAHSVITMKPPYHLTEEQWADLGIMLDKVGEVIAKLRAQVKAELEGVGPEEQES